MSEPHTIDPSEESDGVATGEMTLWRAVISQAINDGINNHRSDANRGARETAREWFRRCGPQYRFVAELAGYNPLWLATKAQELFEKADRGELSVKTTAKPVRTAKLYTFNGKSLTLTAWAEATGIDPRTLRSRVKFLGWSIERAVTAPINPKRTRQRDRWLKAPGAGPDSLQGVGTGGGSEAQYHDEIG
jgi:hypothetical protein